VQELKGVFESIDQMIRSCDIDFSELSGREINETLFANYTEQRLVNSFLFNFQKIQDRIGAKLFKRVLFILKETDDFSLPMVDVLHLLEKLDILENMDDWERLRELRNALSHEYPLDIQERVENIGLALQGYGLLKGIYFRLKEYCSVRGLV
jgi:hypothetical protein